MYIADLHIHSKYSRATSRECTPEHLDLWARRKGIGLLGTGDFTHPAWRKELEEKLVPAEEGLYVLKEEFRLKDRIEGGGSCPRFVVSGEISSIYKKHGRVRKVHNVILLPGLEEAEVLSRKLETIGNIHSDGRPILGLDSRDLLEITLELCPRAIFVPAHIWTPHFSMFGAFSGFDTIEECFEDLTPYIRAFETGLSSDPPMNWRVSALDRLQMISNSDAHSPAKLGREANLLETPMCYEGLYGAIQEGKGLAGTIEFFPEEGKYHFDGHRKCHLCLSPHEADKYQGKCPVCGRKLTMGVSHRIEQLADRDEGYARPGARPFESLVPLPEVIAASTGHSAASVKVQKQYGEMIRKLGPEFSILREIPDQEIQREAGYLVAEGIRRLRRGDVQRFPGFDGEYGVIKLFEPWELETIDGQMSMFGWNGKEERDSSKAAGGEAKVQIRAAAGQDGEDADQVRKEADRNPGKEDQTPAEAAERTGNPEKTKAQENRKTETEGKPEPAGNREELNPEQREAVSSVFPRIAVIAGPGTGKTKTLVSRILYLLQNRRVKPSEITAVTFTNKAAREMENRLAQQLGGKKGIRNLHIGTFHGICYELLKEAGEEFLLADQGTALEMAAEVAEELGIKGKPSRLLRQISEQRTGAAGQRAVRAQDAEAACPENCLDQAVALYEEKLAGLGALDFDDLMLRTLQLWKDKQPEHMEQMEKRFAYLLVDEFQDISPLQHELIRAWSGRGREIFIIGDPDQAIYGFRGADSQSFLRFQEDGDTKVIRLRENYRSVPQVLQVSQNLMEKGASGFTALKPVRDSGLPVRLIRTSGEMGEAVFVAKEINRLVGGIDMLDAQEGFSCPDDRAPRSFGDIAVLYRTHRQAQLLETCLKKEGIPYIVTGREEFLEEDSVRGSLAFFRSILNPSDTLSRAVCLKLLWNLREDDMSRCVYQALAEKYEKLCRRGKPSKIWSAWMEETGLGGDLAMEKLAGMAVCYKTMRELADGIAFGQEGDVKRCGGKTYSSDAVTLMTLHGAKGLEFPAVLLYGVRDGMIPLEYPGREADLAEERRLLYVGMTRAKDELIMTESGKRSRFLEELPEGGMMREEVKQKTFGQDGGRQMSLFDFMEEKH